MSTIEFWLAFVSGLELGQVSLLVILLIISGNRDRCGQTEDDDWGRESDVRNRESENSRH